MTTTTASGVLERALADLPARLTWLDGRRLVVAGAHLDIAGGAGAIVALAGHLYADWYAQASPSGDIGPGDDVTEALRAAHAAASFEPGWRAVRVSSAARVLAKQDGETRLLHPVDYVCPSRPGLPPEPGAEVLAVARRDSPEPVEGYWMTWGRGWPPADAPPLMRVYWNVGVEAAPALVGALTAALGALAHPWLLKLPVDARQHTRADAVVLYLPRRDFAAAAPALRGVAIALSKRLLDAEPPLALRLTAGVALAEDPGGTQSFGTDRCRLLAEAIASSAGPAPPSAATVLAAVRARFAAAGLDPDRPHLEPGAGAEYPWGQVTPVAPPAPAPPTRLPTRTPARAPAPGDEGFLAAAQTIAGRLVEEALWSGERCTWVGDALEPTDGVWSVVLRACDGDLYAGTAGIAWFLARIDDAAARATAAGGARHALRWAAGTTEGGGLYEGPLGTAMAVLDVAAALGDEDLRRQAMAAASGALAGNKPHAAHDLLAGEAGTVVAGLALERARGAPGDGADALGAARAAGERLLDAAQRTTAGWWWDAPGADAPTGLCGLAHGGAGIALAFAALHRRTGEARFGEGAREALRWERRWFSRTVGGWPDLRGEVRQAGSGEPSYPALWCHGAAGVGLSRLMLHAWTGECAPLAEAGAAIQATRRSVAGTLAALASDAPGEDANWSVCHGLSGSAELLLTAWEALGHPDHLAAARRIGAVALHDGHGGRGPWRCGVPEGGGETPGLMLGLAGIGTTLLRLHDPRLAPSPALFGLPQTPVAGNTEQTPAVRPKT